MKRSPSQLLLAVVSLLVLIACSKTSTHPRTVSSTKVRTPASSTPTISGWPPPIPKFTPAPPGHYPGKVLLAEEGYFRFNYPPMWTVDRLNPDNIAVYAPPGIPGQSPALLHANILPLPIGMTLQGFEKVLMKGKNKYRVLGVRKGRLSGLPSYVLTSVPLVAGPPWKSAVAVCVWHGTGYEVGLTATQSSWKTYLPALALELHSFRVTAK